jgi:biotin carboxylase
MPRVVVVLPSNTYKATDFLAAAEASGIDLIVASEQPPPLDMGDRYVTIDCNDTEAAAESITRLGETVPIDAVVAADDRGVMVAAHASARLGLAGNRPENAILTRNKLAMRHRLDSAEVDQPRFAALRPGDMPDDIAQHIGFPVVIKPIDRTASQGVIRVDRPEDMLFTAARIRRIVGPNATLLVESFAPGAEIAIEGLVSKGDLTTLAVFDKPDTGPGPFFPETIFVTPSRLPEAALAEAERVAAASVRALGLAHGPVHIELRVDERRARIIEVAGRSIGGLCSRSLNFGLMGTSLESLILRNAIEDSPPKLRREPTANGVLMIPTPGSGRVAAIRGEDETRRLEGVTGIDFTVRVGEQVTAPPEGDRYLGFVYARGDTPDEVETVLRKAMDNLEVQLEG